MATTPLITFGIELEFICLRPDDLFDDVRVDEDSEPCAGAAIFRSLLAHGIRATGWELEEELVAAPSHSRWRVESDELMLSESEEYLLPDGWSAESIELSSRVFHFFLDEWREEFAKVLKVLREVESLGCRFITNKSTGFHVHVGNGNERIPLRVAKNVFQLATAFERCFDELHATSRIFMPTKKKFGIEYYPAYPPSFFHTFGSAYDESKGLKSSSLLQRLANTEEISSYEDLSAFFTVTLPEFGIEYETSGHSSNVNFDNLVPPIGPDGLLEPCTGTIEFRQHTGTLDFLEIIGWVSLLCKLVDFSMTAPASDVLDLIVRGVDIEFRLQDFLIALDCSEDVIDHYLNGPVIGVVSEENSHLTGATTETSVDLLIAQNDSECEERSDRTAVEAVIDQKYVSGLYGIDSNRGKIEMPPCIAAVELKKACVTVGMSGGDVSTEDGLSKARAQVLKQFAYFYSLGTTEFGRGT